VNRAAFAGAALIGVAIAAAVTLEAPEPGASAHGRTTEPVASIAPSASEAPAAPPVPGPISTPLDLDAGGAEPSLVGFDGGPSALDPMPSLDLPSGSSKTVRFGVILVGHSAAQGAAPGSRTKAAAHDLAVRLAEQAKTDFKAAVAGGDSGSMDDAGRIGRGVLEPESEAALFQLEAGGVSAPIDTPRGFWIVKRLD